MLIVGTFVCISMMCPKGSISGPRVKVAAELVRPSGLLFLHGFNIKGYADTHTYTLTH